jgi:hypothetical protein
MTTPMFVRNLPWFLVFIAGCAPTVFSGPRRCTSTDECGEGAICRDGLCVEVGSTADGGTGTDDDAGMDVNPGEDSGVVMPTGEELCGNGRDDDGDGMADEQCACAVGETQACYAGPVSAGGVGMCALGSQSCTGSSEFGSWTDCTGWTPPAEETCDGLDNDCDGTADEGCGCTDGETRDCYTGPPETAGVGICAPGSQACVAGAWGACDGSVLPGTDVCDGVDNDCDGFVDEGCSCSLGATRGCFETPAGMPGMGAPGVGLCRNGTARCESAPGGGSTWGPCDGAVTATSEICRNGTDEDCDNLIDEGCGTPTVDCTVADVLFLVDVTGSMSEEIYQIQTRLRDTIIPGLAAEIADVRFAVASFGDFAYGGYGSSGDTPFTMLQPITSSVTSAQNAVNLLRATGGGDGPESQTEGLFQSATGAGLAGWVPPRSGCAAGTIGYPCFRSGATPIILLFTDWSFHNGPGGSEPYIGIPGAHTYAQAVAQLNAINARVLGLMSGGAFARADLEQIARDTGALASDGSPIVFDIGYDGSSLGTDVVRAVQTLCR